MNEGLTYEEIGAQLFFCMQTDTYVKIACPFGCGLADFIGRNNDNYARKFCAGGCSPSCYWEMIAENRSRYDRGIMKLNALVKEQKGLDEFGVKA